MTDPESGSAGGPTQSARLVGPVPPLERVEVTVRVRPKAEVDPDRLAAQAAAPPAERHYPSREEFADAHGADPADLAAVEAFARSQGLAVEGSRADLRTVTLSGPAEVVARAFGTSLSRYQAEGATFRAPSSAVTTPVELREVIQGVFGLDDRPHARPHDDPTA